MGFKTTTYQRKPIYVEAVQVTKENFQDVLEWCQGDHIKAESESSDYIKVRVLNPQNPRQTKAFKGDWVIYSDFYGYKVYTHAAFKNSFDKSELMAAEAS